MKRFRKIKLFKFADFASYQECQESANDYYAEIIAYNIEATVNFTVDFIAITLPENKGIQFFKDEKEYVFKCSGKDIISAINKNVNSDKIRSTTPDQRQKFSN